MILTSSTSHLMCAVQRIANLVIRGGARGEELHGAHSRETLQNTMYVYIYNVKTHIYIYIYMTYIMQHNTYNTFVVGIMRSHHFCVYGVGVF